MCDSGYYLSRVAHSHLRWLIFNVIVPHYANATSFKSLDDKAIATCIGVQFLSKES